MMSAGTNLQNKYTVESLSNEFSGELRTSMREMYGSLIIERGLWSEILEVIDNYHDPRVAFRASWALEWAYFSAREDFLPYKSAALAVFMRSGNGSVHRHFAKMILDMLTRGIITAESPEAAPIAEKCFDLLVGKDTKVAVKAWAMDILWHLAPAVEWVNENLGEILRKGLGENPSPGYQNRASRILKRKRKP